MSMMARDGHALPPRLFARVLVALVLGVGAACLVWRIQDYRRASDLGQVWFAARALAQHRDPYLLIGPGREFRWKWPLYYPLTAPVSIAPLALLTQQWACALFAGISTALLVFAITRERWGLLWLVPTAAFYSALVNVQWSPLLMAAALLPPLGFLLAAKPTLGLALWVAYPSRSAVWGAFFVLAISLALAPGWPLEWVSTVRSATHFRAPIQLPGGPILALALLRWRRPEARLLATLACVPQTLFAYETLPLFLVARSWRDALVLALTGMIAWVLIVGLDDPSRSWIQVLHFSGILILISMYLPALVMVLRRPNEGEVPAWLDRLSTVLPPWLRGRAPASV
jgi:hypothetical protein